MIRELICINCPMGCMITVEIRDGEILSVAGNTCPRGKNYALTEVTHPMRMITTVLPVKNGNPVMVSCKTDQPVPKEKIFDVMKALQHISVQAPVEIGDILMENPADTGVNIIATKRIEKI